MERTHRPTSRVHLVLLGVLGALLALAAGLYLLRSLLLLVVAHHECFVLGFLALVALWAWWAGWTWLRHRLDRAWAPEPQPEEPPSP